MFNLFIIAGEDFKAVRGACGFLKESRFKYTHLWLNNVKLNDVWRSTLTHRKNICFGLQLNDKKLNRLNEFDNTLPQYLIYGSLKPKVRDKELNKLENVLRCILLNASADKIKKYRDALHVYFDKFILLMLVNEKLNVLTDYFGYYTLYGTNINGCTIYSASKKKLWAFKKQISSDLDIIPTHSSIPALKIKLPHNYMEIISRLHNQLLKVISELMPYNSKLGIFFSGGLDSLILTKLIIDVNKVFKNDLFLFSCGKPNSKDLKNVLNVNKYLKLPLNIIYLDASKVLEILPKLFEIIERYDTLNISLAIPEYLILENAVKHNIQYMFSGQGADEIFYGYNKYKQSFIEGNSVDELSEGDLSSLSYR
ncbi:MAG: asparagine synthase C-terminal domain-containing protein, partial [Candidatus Odinarchaeia archaeon]